MLRFVAVSVYERVQMPLGRTHLRRRRREDAAETKARNRIRKDKFRSRRDLRMIEKLQTGTLPYTPAVMSWVSARLGKPAAKITANDIKTVQA